MWTFRSKFECETKLHYINCLHLYISKISHNALCLSELERTDDRPSEPSVFVVRRSTVRMFTVCDVNTVRGQTHTHITLRVCAFFPYAIYSSDSFFRYMYCVHIHRLWLCDRRFDERRTHGSPERSSVHSSSDAYIKATYEVFHYQIADTIKC